VTAKYLAGAHDVAREFRDFGDAEFWASDLSAMARDYAIKSDARCLSAITAAATARPNNADANAGLIDALLFVAAQAPATFALVSSDVLTSILSPKAVRHAGAADNALGGNVDNPLGGVS